MAQIVLEGLGSLKRYPEFLETFQVSRPLVVGGKRYQDCIRAEAWFDGYHPNPDLADAQRGVKLFKAHQCDCLISIGGGSAMDTAKAIKYYLETPDLPHLAIPATAGTGSECTRYAVVYVDRRKSSLDLDHLTPDAVILDGELLKTLPAYHKRASLMDALAQCIESYWAPGACVESRGHAARGIRLILEHLDAYLSGRDPQADQAMSRAAYQSGRAIQYTRTTAPHAMSYHLVKTTGIAHGHAVGLTLPYVWEHLRGFPRMAPTLEELDHLLGGSGPRILLSLLDKLELHAPPAEGIDLNDLVASVNVQRLSNHPVSLTEEELRNIYILALGR